MTTSTLIALVGVRGVVLLVISLPAILFGLILLPMVVVDHAPEILIIVEVGPKIGLIDLIIAGVVASRVVRVAGLSLNSAVILPQVLDLCSHDVETCLSLFDLG